MHEWQKLYEQAVCETDEGKLKSIAAALEAALFLRLQELAKHNGDGSHNSEHFAIQTALKDLRRLQVERLHFPPLQQRDTKIHETTG